MRSRRQGALADTLPLVRFTTSTELPAPSPRYIALYAACTKVAHLSGASEYIDMVIRDMEGTRVLANDGSSADVLAHALYLTASAQPLLLGDIGPLRWTGITVLMFDY